MPLSPEDQAAAVRALREADTPWEQIEQIGDLTEGTETVKAEEEAETANPTPVRSGPTEPVTARRFFEI